MFLALEPVGLPQTRVGGLMKPLLRHLGRAQVLHASRAEDGQQRARDVHVCESKHFLPKRARR